MEQNMSLLGYALLGLLQQQARSGYDLRKIFSATPLRSFSDSPGSIYPALHRLEQRGFIRSRVEPRSGLRRRRLFRPTSMGLLQLQRWQSQPVTDDALIRGVDGLMLRFGFMDESLGPAHSLNFLKSLEHELEAYIPTLRDYFAKQGADLPLSGRLALESGISRYESLLRWARCAIATYRKETRGRKTS